MIAKSGPADNRVPTDIRTTRPSTQEIHTMSETRAARAENRTSRRSALLTLLLAIVSLVGLTAVTTGALFSDSATVSGTSFVTGTVDINASAASVPLTMTNMAPGDTLTAGITVQNAGTLAERYAMSIKTDDAASDTLAGQLAYTVKAGVTTCTTAGFGSSGTEIYTGPLASSAGTKVIGDNTSGSQAGDRTLSAGASENLCMQVSLPLATGNAFQGKTANVTMTFDSEQIANNP